MNLSGDGSTVSVGSLWPAQLGIGGGKVEQSVYVAPLQDDMFVRIDLSFLQK